MLNLFKKRQGYRFKSEHGPLRESYCLYYVPRDGEEAAKYDCKYYVNASAARFKRRQICEEGIKVAIHVGVQHPDPLPFGETLWLEPTTQNS